MPHLCYNTARSSRREWVCHVEEPDPADIPDNQPNVDFDALGRPSQRTNSPEKISVTDWIGMPEIADVQALLLLVRKTRTVVRLIFFELDWSNVQPRLSARLLQQISNTAARLLQLLDVRSSTLQQFVRDPARGWSSREGQLVQADFDFIGRMYQTNGEIEKVCRCPDMVIAAHGDDVISPQLLRQSCKQRACPVTGTAWFKFIFSEQIHRSWT